MGRLNVGQIQGITAPDYRIDLPAGSALSFEDGSLRLLNQSYLPLPYGATTARPASDDVHAASLRWNSTTNSLEVYGNSGWLNAALSESGGGGSAIIPQQGLVMHIESWNSDSYPGTGNTWFDLTDNNHDITLGSSVTFVSSVAGGVLNFPENGNGYGRNSSMNLSNSNNTVITWVRKNSNGNNGRTVTAQGNNWLLGHHDTSRNDYYAEGWVNNISSPQSDTVWRMYTGTGHIANDVWQLYVNTTLEASNNSGSQGPNGWNLNNQYSQYSDCQIAFLACWNRVLSSAEIAQVYSITSGRFS